ncbi:hypothetical protein F2P56_016451 [Juglans regia]|uniref:Protein SAWADEE HOMEODOMAIN HOMOLOG 1 n=2 Tax=Juglans regia TaxID=51240 RepID=A0A2I4G5J0_JUGRE|nr:protein SAWADEE HOMEODOMAIN HOMOLOG 1 [Juglans regia]KAF5466533.1 hypothetical protein F2P56_016451 [Juglans regia]
MDWFKREDSDDSCSEFTLAEIMEMEKIFKGVGEQSLGPEFFQDIATSFSSSASRAGKSIITWRQVESWFQNKQEQPLAKFTPSHGVVKLFVDTPDAPISNNASNAPESSPSPKGKRITDISELSFEAKSSKDGAWYDVASFQSYRFINSGELEVRVRFAGFSNDEDEWINVKRGVRERSIPLEPSECEKVKVGDLVLCFQERDDHAVYCDAYIMEIQRIPHDINCCRCIFVVRYDHDCTEEKVQLERICARPKDYSGSTSDVQTGLTQYHSRLSFDIPDGVKFPF